MTDTGEPLRRYVKDSSEQAFNGVVQHLQRLGLFAAACRVGGDISVAQDITQLIFVDSGESQLAHNVGAFKKPSVFEENFLGSPSAVKKR
jgi:hypothetical protein